MSSPSVSKKPDDLEEGGQPLKPASFLWQAE
jgi:hypothetical protein